MKLGAVKKKCFLCVALGLSAIVDGYRCMRQEAVQCFPHRIGDVLLKSGISNRYIANFGANDGITIDETWHWFQRAKWPGMAVEPMPKLFAKLKRNYAINNAFLFKDFATPETVVRLLKEGQAPRDMFLFKIDIDGYDIKVIEKMLEAGYRPHLLFCEHNEKIPPPFRFYIDYKVGTPNRYVWGQHTYGASSMALADIMHKFGYILLGIPYGNNMVWIHNKLVRNVSNQTQQNNDDAVACAYVDGYYNHHMASNNTGTKYSWNRDVDFFLHTSQGSLQERGIIMRTYLNQKSYRACVSRQQQKNPSFCEARKKAVDQAAIHWPSAPPGTDPNFLESCARISQEPRVQLLATSNAIAHAIQSPENKIALTGTSYSLHCNSQEADFYVVDRLPSLPLPP